MSTLHACCFARPIRFGVWKLFGVWILVFGVFTTRAAETNIASASFVWSEAAVGKVFDAFWREMDLNYSYFVLKTNADWAALKDQYRPKAVQTKSTEELVEVLRQMLSPLDDMHIWIQTSKGITGTHSGNRSVNANAKVTFAAVEPTMRCGQFALVGKTKTDGFGYFLIMRQTTATDDLVKQTIAAIDALGDVAGFIVDLRSANGGNEAFAQQIASRFCAKDVVYAKSKYRNGPGHGDFTKAYDRVLKAGDAPYTKPIVCLIGPGAISSGEGFVKMMKALPHVTTVGVLTRGASGNPKPFTLGETGVTVIFSRWVDMLPNGETFEGRGIPPEILVDEPATAYADRDPTLEKGLEILRQKISKTPK